MSGEDKHWAQKYLIDPLTAPDPSDETGLGSSSFSRANGAASSKVNKNSTGGSSSNPFRRSIDSAPQTKDNVRVRSSSLKSGASTTTTVIGSGYPSGLPPSYKEAAYGADSSNPWQRRSVDDARPVTSNGVSGHVRRHSSLKERFPGDKSLHPLDEIKRENRRANRAPHLRKRHQPGRDSIDRLDNIGLPGASYHHEGPYDAALLQRNTSYESSPIAAVQRSNNEALKATPEDKIHDSLNAHMPLEGTATFPPGSIDPLGRQYSYEEGENVNIIGAGVDAYARWPGVTYRDDDHKGKGEPGWDESARPRNRVREARGKPGVVELMESSRQRNTSGGSSSHVLGGGPQSYAEWEQARTEHHIGDGLKKRFGSMKNKLHT